MHELTDWIRTTAFPAKPWLLLGKGPTFDRRDRYDLGEFNLFALNHVVGELPVDVAHVIDVDVVGMCAGALLANARWVLMPRYPHLRSANGDRALEGWFDDYPVLRTLDEEGRLVWYNLAESGPVEGSSPVVVARHFSSEAALGILGRMGATVVRSLGIDGGRAYATTFDELAEETLLANNAPSFDLQFERIRIITEENGIDYRPLVDPLRIFVGVDESQLVAYRVLEYSIRKAASIPVEITPMLDFPYRLPRAPENQPRTQFSFTRFMIPKLCGYEGRALYLDADMLVFDDVAELADLPFDGHSILRNRAGTSDRWAGRGAIDNFGAKLSVMLLDCSRLRWDVEHIVDDLDAGRYDYRALMADLCIVDPAEIADTIAPEWNDLEHYDPGSTKLIHFTVVPTQPWKVDDNPLNDLWMSWYREAVEAGAVPPDEVESLVVLGLVKPSLRAALRLAPARRSPVTSASLDRDGALIRLERQIAELEDQIRRMHDSSTWRIGSSVVGAGRRASRMVRRLRPTAK